MAEEQEKDLSLGANEKVGDYLRRVREARGLELEHMAKSIRLGINIVDAIEKNRWSDFPTEAYLRSYIISMCEKLLVDKNLVIKRFSSDVNSRFGVTQTNIMSEPAQEKSSSQSSTAKIAVIIVLMIAIALFFSKEMLLDAFTRDDVVPVPPAQELAQSDELAENDGEQSEASDEDKTAAPETASAAPVSSQKTQDTLLFECLSNTCGVSLKGFDTKMHYFTKTASRYINHNDTVQITITVPIRTKLLMNGSKLEYGKYNNTLLFHKGNIISKSNRDLR